MSNIRFLYHTNCEQCGSKDNLGVWEDNHKYCFGCGYKEKGTTSIHRIHGNIPKLDTKDRGFPDDAAYYIPAEPMKWLLSCGIDYSSQRQYGIQWSEKQQLVCWRIGEDCWQGRCFNPKAKTKYISQGKIHAKPHIINPDKTKPLVLVEDFISALRISQVYPAMPLFGCTINLELFTELLGHCSSIVVWLDSDKLNNARKIASHASLLGFDPVQVLYTEKDPKNYSLQEIIVFLTVFK